MTSRVIPIRELRVVVVCWKCGAPLADTMEGRGPDGYSCLRGLCLVKSAVDEGPGRGENEGERQP
jgi:hypothetical protein